MLVINITLIYDIVQMLEFNIKAMLQINIAHICNIDIIFIDIEHLSD